MMEQGILFILSGPSGVGKGTVLAELMNDFHDINYSISATTRRVRDGEVDGEDYFFLSQEKFMKMKENGEFIEWAKVHNNYYGTPRNYVNKCLNNNKDVILEIDIQGANQVRKQYPGSVLIFLVPPSFKELEKRLEKRGSESQRCKKIRLENARDELKETVNYDYEVVNNKVEEAVKNIKDIILKEKRKRKG